MRLAFTALFACLALQAGTALAYNESDERDSRLCGQLVVPVSEEVYNHKKQGFSPEDSFKKIAGEFQDAMAKKPLATGSGSDIVNEFNKSLAASHVKLIHDLVMDAANHPFFSSDKAYPQYVLRCINSVRKIKADLAEKHRNELQQFRDQ